MTSQDQWHIGCVLADKNVTRNGSQVIITKSMCDNHPLNFSSHDPDPYGSI